MMIATVTLNPALDYLVSPAAFALGEINRYAKYTCAPGGKGINVSLLLASLGAQTRALAIAAGFSGKEAARLLEEKGCPADFLFLPQGQTRINVKVSPPGGPETDLNGEGPDIPLPAVGELAEKLAALAPGDMVVLAGSVPPSLPRDVYARLLEPLAARGVQAVVDTTGEALLAALPYHPFLVKPNLEELGELFGVEIATVEEAKEYGKLLQEKGARNVVVSMGAKGAMLLEENGRCLFCHGVRGDTVSTVGAGDSLVAGSSTAGSSTAPWRGRSAGAWPPGPPRPSVRASPQGTR